MDTTAQVEAIISPASSSGTVTFRSSDGSKASIQENSRWQEGDVIHVSISVYGHTPSDPNTFPSESASIIAEDSGDYVSSIYIKVVIPATVVRVQPSANCVNNAQRNPNNNDTIFSIYMGGYVGIAFLDQFQDRIPSLYDASGVVYETFSAVTQAQGIFGNVWSDGFIDQPTGLLEDGVILDHVNFTWYVEKPVHFASQIKADWESGIGYQGHNTVFGLTNWEPWAKGNQRLTVHGWPVSPDAYRVMKIFKDNWIPGNYIPCDIYDRPLP